MCLDQNEVRENMFEIVKEGGVRDNLEEIMSKITGLQYEDISDPSNQDIVLVHGCNSEETLLKVEEEIKNKVMEEIRKIRREYFDSLDKLEVK